MGFFFVFFFIRKLLTAILGGGGGKGKCRVTLMVVYNIVAEIPLPKTPTETIALFHVFYEPGRIFCVTFCYTVTTCTQH